MLKSYKLASFTILILALIAIILYGGIKHLLTPVAQSGSEVRFVISKGQSMVEISAKLATAGLIRSQDVFRFYVRFKKLDTKIQAGSFTLSPTQSTPEIARVLTEGTEDVWITLLEGWRREEIAEYLQSADLAKFDKTEFLELTASSEGYLFPDTYLVPKEITTQALVDLFVATFEKKVTILGDLPPIKLKRLVILASLIEREARGRGQMKHVAGILENRLKVGMPLQVDATLQYIRGNVDGEWWILPRSVDKKLPSPFNTYLNAGLPPRPIANPGLLALQAAFAPNKTSDYYYLHTPSGEIYYAPTYKLHLQNIARYLQ